ncbi:MAG: hypothetical protein K2G77_02410, partial [Muribaculaceae bacterium]|nr:hypothetical protein [Muribaculaceae bacterium]
EYDTADQGNPLKRTVLFVTFWYKFFDQDDNRKKFTSMQLLEATASFKYESLAESTRIGYITGFCNYRKELRTFNIKRIKGGRVFECRKNLHKLSVNDIWRILKKVNAEIALSMYNELNDQEQKYLYHLGNYANALALLGKIEEAVSIYKSTPADLLMPQSTITWKEACMGDIEFFITNNLHKTEFQNILSIMRKNGW